MSFDAEHGAEGPVLWEEHGAWFTAEKDLELPLPSAQSVADSGILRHSSGSI